MMAETPTPRPYSHSPVRTGGQIEDTSERESKPQKAGSMAERSLKCILTQAQLGTSRKDAPKSLDGAPGPQAKGKPRLLLMGQRR